MVLKDTPGNTLQKFQTLVSEGVTREKLIAFVNSSFSPPGQEFEPWSPSDWKTNPQLLSQIADSNLRSWAAEIHALWKDLGRKVKKVVKDQPEQYSQIYVPNAVIVPGGRFLEFYYWDSYWVINGLLLSEMNNTARGMIENFLYMVDRFGLIPNGGRVYYLRRSQPPFLTLMMDSYMTYQKDMTFLRENIHLLEKEYDFWMNNRTVTVTLGGKSYLLNHYHVPVGGPRPESYSDDYELAETVAPDSQQSLLAELKAAAESGWDFSSRWFSGSVGNSETDNKLNMTRTSSVVPADLNGILCRVEKTLAKFYKELNMPEKESRFQTALTQRLEAVQSVLWDEGLGIWLDYNMDAQRRNTHFYPSNLVPLWATCYSNPEVADRVVSYLEKSGALSYKNGIPTSLTRSGQQWDFPNAWPPLQHMVIEGLAQAKSSRAKDTAFSLAQNWIRTNYKAYTKYKGMFEKYDVEGDGKPGGGGEYEVQVGFGWSNGVALQLLERYKTQLTAGTTLCRSLSWMAIILTIVITFWA
ncbi:trehalase isoform X2 [Xenopus laevis]|nr:trehalase isoform X2 [Xenopus laevis]